MSSEPCDLFDENVQDPVSIQQSALSIDNSQTFNKVNASPQEVIIAGSDVYVPAPFQRYLLNINLKQGRNLVIRDKRSGRLQMICTQLCGFFEA